MEQSEGRGLFYMKEVLRVVNLSKSFGDTKAINRISFTCGEKELLVILGPTGAGKTTTLRLIAGLEVPDEGEIYLEGKSINTLPPFLRSCAMTFEDYALYPHMNVFENIASPLKAPVRKGTSTLKEIERTVVQTAKFLEIDMLLKRKPSELSGGQKQRVALGRTLVRKPKIFLLDEPIAHLDAALRHRMRAEMKRIFKSLESTVLYVTHDYMEALAMADRIIVLRHGTIQQIGTPYEIYFEPTNKFVAGFLGDPPMNFFKGYATPHGDYWLIKINDLEFSVKRVSNLISKGDVIVGVRPSDIHIIQQSDVNKNGIEAKVRAVEPLGDKYIVTMMLENNEMVKLKLKSKPKIELDKSVQVVFPANCVHLFDPKSSKALWHGRRDS